MCIASDESETLVGEKCQNFGDASGQTCNPYPILCLTLVILDLGVKRWSINSIRIGPLYVEFVELELELELELESELELVDMGMCMGLADTGACALA